MDLWLDANFAISPVSQHFWTIHLGPSLYFKSAVEMNLRTNLVYTIVIYTFSWQILTFLLLEIVIVLMRLKIKKEKNLNCQLLKLLDTFSNQFLHIWIKTRPGLKSGPRFRICQLFQMFSKIRM